MCSSDLRWQVFFFVCFVFFFQAEDGIRDVPGDWSSDVCSSDLAGRIAGRVTKPMSVPVATIPFMRLCATSTEKGMWCTNRE